MYYRVIDSFLHQLRAGRDDLPAHDDLRQLYADAIDKLGLLADGLYKRDRKQADPIDRPDF
jgi:hypothetical protein